MGKTLEEELLEQLVFEFLRLKKLGEAAFVQVSDAQLFLAPAADNNSIAVIIQHLSGNMLSRWTDFLTSDGEKSWRNRDSEFEEKLKDRDELLAAWNKGWAVFTETLQSLTAADLQKTVTIRSEPLTVLQALLRQLGHYSYHTGQLVQLAHIHCGENWKSLSIPRGQSAGHSKGNYLSQK